MAKKNGIINNEDRAIAFTNAEKTLSQMKSLERKKTKKSETNKYHKWICPHNRQ